MSEYKYGVTRWTGLPITHRITLTVSTDAWTSKNQPNYQTQQQGQQQQQYPPQGYPNQQQQMQQGGCKH